MECKKHPNVQAVDRCVRCSGYFCADCLVDVQGQKYCGSCKMALTQPRVQAPTMQGRPVIPDAASIPCKEANDALIYSIVGLFCFGIILEPIAISKALKAKEMIKQNPRLEGSGKATAGLVIGVIVLILWVVQIMALIGGAMMSK